MARGPQSPAPAAIPKVSFTKIEDDSSTQPAGVHDQQARSFGYNDFSSFHRPEPYIRYIEPLESELAVQVEYDMDEQDQEWLDAVNLERKQAMQDKVSYETFEIIMDRLEKEWFDLTKNIPKPDMVMPSEDSTCAICDEAEGENSNAIVFCDGCNLAVHQECYGVPYIPEGQWLCRKCTVSPENPVSCILCPNEGGAFKQTIHGEWVHLLCAIWVPETRVANEVFMEPITGVDKINKQRWKLKCALCGIREGACIQCMKPSCYSAFHPTCARRLKLLMPMKSYQSAEHATLTCYCERHLPKEQFAAHQAAVQELQDEEEGNATENSNAHAALTASKTARAYAKSFKIGPPLVPAIIVRKIVDYIARISVRKKIDFVQLVCRYWSLKREARRGAPLLKRLHLEPWTASGYTKPQTDEEKMQRLQSLRLLRKDLETVKILAETTRKREKGKCMQNGILQDLLTTWLFPFQNALRFAFEKITSMDRQDYFRRPVSKIDVPDYFEVIKEPMCWNTIDTKLDANKYWQLDHFRRDINLVLDNAMLYNKPDTILYKNARRIKALAEPTLKDLDSLKVRHQPQPSAVKAEEGTVAEDQPISSQQSEVGDLEPPTSVLKLFLSTDAISSSTDLLLEQDPLASLFSFEFAKFKPPPPPPPPKPKKVRDRKAEYERKKARAEERAARRALLDSSPGFRAAGPFTRRTRASAAALLEGDTPDAAHKTQGSEAGPSTESSSSKGHKKGKWKRKPFVLPGQTTVPPVVEDIDKQKSFSMFDEGWILPEGQRRGGRAAVEKHDQPPRKRARTADRQKSSVSKYSTPASENQTLRTKDELPDDRQEGYHITPSQDDSMEVVEAELKKPTTSSAKRAEVIIIEELDTPGIRRSKNQAKKEKREEIKRQKDQAMIVQQEEISDLSSLSSLDDSDDEVGGSETASKAERTATVKATLVSTAEPGQIILEEGKMLEGGTLVWAKAESYPWWPAVIFEEDDDRVPWKVIDEKDEIMNRRAHVGLLHLVQFYDKRSSWQWLDVNHLKLLGENKDLDGDMMGGTKTSQRFKNSKVKHECRTAFRKAIAEMETPMDLEEEASQGTHNEAEESKDQVENPTPVEPNDMPIVVEPDGEQGAPTKVVVHELPDEDL